MKSIRLATVPSQKLSSVLGGQNCQINVYQKTTGLYVDVSVNDVQLVGGAVARDRVRIVRHAYLGFIGDLVFIDTQGVSDPDYTGFGGRYQLVYLEATDV